MRMPQTAKRLNNFTESVIREMTRVAIAHGAINLSQGFPDFAPPAELVKAAVEALSGDYHQYSVTYGAPQLRQALAKKQSRYLGLDLDPETNIVITCGSTEAMLAAMMTCCNPGDKVVIFSPFYENYTADTILAGAEPIYVPLRSPDFTFDPEELRETFLQRPKALILCNPSNPTGRVFTLEELSVIADLAREFDAFVITDEVYEHIVYPPNQHTYISTLPDMFDRTISCGSLSKTYAITGWRLGYVIASRDVIEGIRKVHDFLSVGAPHPLQIAAVTALNFPESYYQTLVEDYSKRRELFLGFLDQTSLPYVRPQGAYYVMVDISRFGCPDDNEFCLWLAKEIGVAGVPGSSFFKDPVNHYIRLHFAKRGETLIAAGERLSKLATISLVL